MTDREYLIGRLAVQKGLVTRDLLEECARACREAGPERSLLDVLVEHGCARRADLEALASITAQIDQPTFQVVVSPEAEPAAGAPVGAETVFDADFGGDPGPIALPVPVPMASGAPTLADVPASPGTPTLADTPAPPPPSSAPQTADLAAASSDNADTESAEAVLICYDERVADGPPVDTRAETDSGEIRIIVPASEATTVPGEEAAATTRTTIRTDTPATAPDAVTEIPQLPDLPPRERAAAVPTRLPATGLEPEEVRHARTKPEAVFGRYVLVDLLGRGGMGSVHRAWDDSLHRFVALKLMNAESRGAGGTTADDEGLQRFQREARTAAQLRHPNIVQILDVGEYAGRHYLSMEYVKGVSYRRYLEDRRLRMTTQHARPGEKPTPADPWREPLEILRQVALALDHAHRQNVVHRDIKPENILLRVESGATNRPGTEPSGDTATGMPEGARFTPLLADFGLARDTVSSQTITLTGQVMGTPGYMSPEQAEGKNRQVDGRSDIFALGIILYETVGGRRPFEGASPATVLYHVMMTDPTPPRQVNPQVPAGLDTIILKALEKDPARRYQNADALADDLGRFLTGQPVQAQPLGAGQRLGRRLARHKLAVAACTATALFAVLLAAFAVYPWLERRARVRDYAGRAEALVREEKYAEALALCEKIRTLDPSNEEARLLTSVIQGKAGPGGAPGGVPATRPPGAGESPVPLPATHPGGGVQPPGITPTGGPPAGEPSATAAAATRKAALERARKERDDAERAAEAQAAAAAAEVRRQADREREGLERTAVDQAEAARKAAEEKAAREHGDAQRREEEEAARRKAAEDEAARTAAKEKASAERDAARRREAEEAARRQAAADEAARKAAEEKAAAERAEAQRREAEEAARRKAAAEEAARKQREAAEAAPQERLRSARTSLESARSSPVADAESNRAALRLLDQALASDPDLAEAVVERGYRRFLLGQVDAALADAGALAASPAPAGVAALYLRGRILMDARPDPTAGGPDLDAVARRAEVTAVVALARARINLLGRRFEDAFGWAGQAERLGAKGEDLARVRGLAGALAAAPPDPAAVLADLDLALAVPFPDLGLIYYRGLFRLETGNAAAAVADAQALLAADPKSIPARLLRARVRLATGDADGAITDYRDLLGLDRDNQDALLGRAEARLLKGAAMDALTDANRAIEVNSKSPVAYETRARVRMELTNAEGAISDCTKALSLDPNLVRAYLTRGLARLARGLRADAAHDFEEFIKRAPHSRSVPLAQQKLEEARRP